MQPNPQSTQDAQTLRRSVGWLDLSTRDRLCLIGADRQRYLNGQVTNNVRDLRPNTGCYSLIVNNKGMIEGDAMIYHLADELLLDLEANQASVVSERLAGYIVSDDVEVIEVTEAFKLLSIQGPHTPQAITELNAHFNQLIPTEPREIVLISETDEGAIYAANHPRCGTVGVDFFVSAERTQAFKALVVNAVQDLGGKECSEAALDVVRIEAGIPKFPVDMTPSVLAPELKQESKSISYTKGCYIGQEVINRIKSIGNVKRQLIGLTFETPKAGLPSPGDRIEQDERVVGRLGSIAFSDALGRGIALGLMKCAAIESGRDVRIQSSEGADPIPAKVSELPLLNPLEVE